MSPNEKMYFLQRQKKSLESFIRDLEDSFPDLVIQPCQESNKVNENSQILRFPKAFMTVLDEPSGPLSTSLPVFSSKVDDDDDKNVDETSILLIAPRSIIGIRQKGLEFSALVIPISQVILHAIGRKGNGTSCDENGCDEKGYLYVQVQSECIIDWDNSGSVLFSNSDNDTERSQDYDDVDDVEDVEDVKDVDEVDKDDEFSCYPPIELSITLEDGDIDELYQCFCNRMLEFSGKEGNTNDADDSGDFNGDFNGFFMGSSDFGQEPCLDMSRFDDA